MDTTKLSNHLSLAEMINSGTAKRLGISNMPTPDHLENMKYLAEKVFEPIRAYFNMSIHVSSGYRSKDLNKAIGGSQTSFHSIGCAMDIDMDNTSISNKEIFYFILNNLDFTELIWEFGTNDRPDWVHVAIVKNREKEKEVLTSKKVGSQTKYFDYKK